MEDTGAVATATATDSGGNTGSAPLTFEQAFAAEASPASDSSAQTTTPPAAEQPASAETTPAPEDRSPFIPRSRFDEVNTRLKQAEAWKQQYGWAEQIPQSDLQAAIALAQEAQRDPIAYMQKFIADLQSHPQHSQALKSLAAKALASRGQQAPTMPEPDVAITDAAGNVVGQTYSAAQMAKRDEWLMQQWMAKVDEKYAPVVQTHEQITKQARDDHDKAEGDKFAKGFTAELAQMYPTFETHKAAVGAEVVRMLEKHANDPRINEPGFLEAITLRAAHKVIGSAEQKTAESRVLDSLQQKAAASTSVNPGSAAPSSSRPITRFDQLGPEAWR